MSREKGTLTPKQERFVQKYLVDLNATQAAIRAGYSQKTAASIGAENLIKPEIAKEIRKGKSALTKKAGLTSESMIQEMMRIGFSNMGLPGPIRP
jgi:phage terminase small subunit